MRPFIDVLRDIRKGRAIDQATAQLALATAAAVDTGKPASVTLTISIKPEKGGERVELFSAVKAKLPVDDPPKATFYVTRDEEGVDLLRDDPDQRPLFGDVEDDRRHRPAAV